MPSTSKKQHRFMEAVAHNPSFAKKVGVPQSVGKDFSNADKGKTFSRGGDMAAKMDPKMMAMMMAKKRGAMAPRGGMAPSAPSGMMGMKKGGMPMVMKDGKKMPAFAADGEGKMKKGGVAGMHKMPDGKMMKDSAMKHGGVAKKMMGGGMAYAKGGGIEVKGKTKGTMIKMKSGGKMC